MKFWQILQIELNVDLNVSASLPPSLLLSHSAECCRNPRTVDARSSPVLSPSHGPWANPSRWAPSECQRSREGGERGRVLGGIIAIHTLYLCFSLCLPHSLPLSPHIYRLSLRFSTAISCNHYTPSSEPHKLLQWGTVAHANTCIFVHS